MTLGSSLTFDAQWNEETGWDFGFVQVSTDGGDTYTSLSCTDTTSDHDPGALPTAVNNVPGFTGDSGGWKPQTCDTSGYAGQTVLLSFRAFNDPGTLGAGAARPFRRGSTSTTSPVDGSSSATARSPAGSRRPRVNPVDVNGFTVQLVAYDGLGPRLDRAAAAR